MGGISEFGQLSLGDRKRSGNPPERQVTIGGWIVSVVPILPSFEPASKPRWQRSTPAFTSDVVREFL